MDKSPETVVDGSKSFATVTAYNGRTLTPSGDRLPGRTTIVRCPLTLLPVLLLAFFFPHPLAAQQGSSPRTILAIGAHAGDMELTCGAVLIHQHRLDDRIVLFHLTLGEGGNPALSPEQYGEQKRREARKAAEIMGAELIVGPYRDGEIPDTEETRRFVADVIRRVKPTHIITHWKNSLHKDHSVTHAVVSDAILLASLEGVVTEHAVHRGVRGIYFAENWEDEQDFEPYLYVDVSDVVEDWRSAVSVYEFVSGDIASFPYLDYYVALLTIRGAEARKPQAVAFDVSPWNKKRILDTLP